uniref:Uncharacterized protein n=1 Tax=Anguilla anguilla TaxID=7936 RepID=A0A0E9S2N0_ANGAN
MPLVWPGTAMDRPLCEMGRCCISLMGCRCCC